MLIFTGAVIVHLTIATGHRHAALQCLHDAHCGAVARFLMAQWVPLYRENTIMILTTVDFGLLQAYVTACRFGSITRAAEASNRTQSAVSMQIRRLEDLVGKRLLARHGRGVRPTAEGEIFFGYAARILTLGDEACARLGGADPGPQVRVGVTQEFTAAELPVALGAFRRKHPRAHVSVAVDTTAGLYALWREERLDVMVGVRSMTPAEPFSTWSIPLHWVCGTTYVHRSGEPLDLVLLDEPCAWRGRALGALDEAGRPWRVAFSSHSLAAVQAAVEDGGGVALLDPSSIRATKMKPFYVSNDVRLNQIDVCYGAFAKEKGELIEDFISSFIATSSNGNASLGTGKVEHHKFSWGAYAATA